MRVSHAWMFRTMLIATGGKSESKLTQPPVGELISRRTNKVQRIAPSVFLGPNNRQEMRSRVIALPVSERHPLESGCSCLSLQCNVVRLYYVLPTLSQCEPNWSYIFVQVDASPQNLFSDVIPNSQYHPVAPLPRNLLLCNWICEPHCLRRAEIVLIIRTSIHMSSRTHLV